MTSTRRRYRARSSAGAVVAAFLLLLGCGRANAVTTLEIGYIPILPMAQLYVIEGEGWAKDAGLSIRKTAFSEGPEIVQALTAGRLDVAFFGIAPAMVSRSKGVDIKVVATNVVEQVALIARGDLTLYMLRDPIAGIKRFAEKQGRKPRIASFSPGSVPYTVFVYWLTQVAKLPADSVEIISMGASDVEQALLRGEVDGASILEPILTTVGSADRSAKVVLDGADMMPNQPGAILAVRGELIRNNPRAARKLVELHNRATDFLILYPEKSAEHAYNALVQTNKTLTLASVQKAMASPYSKFVADPFRILESTQIMHDFQLKSGLLAKPVKFDLLFDTTIFADVSDGR